MIEGVVDFVERLDQLTYQFDEFQANASTFGVFVAFAVLVIFILTIFNYASLRRIEQKVDSMKSDIADLYQDENEE